MEETIHARLAAYQKGLGAFGRRRNKIYRSDVMHGL